MAKITIPQDFMTQFKRHEDLIVFLHLLLNSDDEGQISVSVSSLSMCLGMSSNVLRRCLNNLEITNKITSKSTNKSTNVTICNSEEYKGKRKTKAQTESQTKAQTEITPEYEREIKFKQRMKEKYPTLSKMREPLTRKQWDELIVDWTSEQIIEVLDAMENMIGICGKYKSTKRTALNWLKRRHGKQ